MLVVAQAQHLGQRQNAQQHDLAADDARQCGEEERHHHGLHRDPAGQAAGEHAHGVEQVLGDARAVEQRGHQHEHRHRHQRILGDEAIYAAGDQRQGVGAEPAEGKGQRHQAGDEGQRQAGDQQGEDRPDHQDRSVGDIHYTAPSLSLGGMAGLPRSDWIRWMND